MTIIQHPSAKLTTPESAIRDFLSELRSANKSPRTLTTYRCELEAFRSYFPYDPSEITVETVRGYYDTFSQLAPATRAKKQAAVSSFLGWCFRNDLIESDPSQKIMKTKVDAPMPRGVKPEDVEKVLKKIPKERARDRLLFGLIYSTGLRASEALGIHVEDVDLSLDDEHILIHGKGGHTRRVLLQDRKLLKRLKAYLNETGYEHGPLFRALYNGSGDELCYQAAYELWNRYCKRAGVSIKLHQLRHTHATQLVNQGVNLEIVRRRLGHKNMQTTLRYAELSDKVADDEIRKWSRRNRQ